MDSELVAILVVVGVVALGALGAVAVAQVRRAVAGALGLHLVVTPVELARCDEVQVQAVVKPRRAFDLDMVEMALVCERTYRERHRDGDGSHVHRDRDELHREQNYVMEGAGPIAAGERRVFRGAFTIPGDAMSSKGGSLGWEDDQRIAITWYVQVRFHLKAFPDAVERRILKVGPRRARAA